MQFAIALIEYLISGIVASAWVIALLIKYFNISTDGLSDILKYKDLLVIVYLPIAYILGIYIDTTSSLIIRAIKNIDDKLCKKNMYTNIKSKGYKIVSFFIGVPKSDPYERSADILSHSIPDMVRTMESYVSRDRMARGMALNSFIGIYVSMLCAPEDVKLQISIFCGIMCIVSILTHKRLRRLSSTFKKQALKKIHNLNAKTPTL
ncbi:hypothetical protein HQ400_20845 [Aeromonas jandaei]|nr:hypothetical protein HQ400_20845 [Aeromonas jandaei]